MAPAPTAMPARRHGGRATLLALALLVGPLLWHCQETAFNFIAGRGAVRLPGIHRGQVTQRRAGAYDFQLVESEDHTNLKLEETDQGNLRVFTAGSFMSGDYNTVLGDTVLPASGRSYWEVKIVKKPTDAWEYIGVAEPTADLTVPLPRNRKGAGWFWGSTHTDSFIYTYLPIPAEWNKQMIDKQQAAWNGIRDLFEVPEKDWDDGIKNLPFRYRHDTVFKAKGTHVGMIQDSHPPFENGMVVGVDVDMDDGSLAFWADGKYLGKVRDTEGKPINLKGKKVVPALTIYGRTYGGGNQYTVMEVTRGMEPPPKP